MAENLKSVSQKVKKKKSESERIYDLDGYWLRAACVCVRERSEEEVLLVSSSSNPEAWIIPGGKIQSKERPEDSAVREAREEAGVIGELGRFLGVFDNQERRHRTRVYMLKVSEILDDYEEKNIRKRSWFSVDEALRLLFSYKPLHCNYLNAMKSTQPSSTNNSSVVKQSEATLKLKS